MCRQQTLQEEGLQLALQLLRHVCCNYRFEILCINLSVMCKVNGLIHSFVFYVALTASCGPSGFGNSIQFDCSFSNIPVTLRCSFDEGEEEDCSLPLLLTIERFGAGRHTVVLTATDEFGQSLSTEFPFSFSSKYNLRVPC